MVISGLILVALASTSFAAAAPPDRGHWAFLDMKDPIGMLKGVPTVGFEPLPKPEGEGGGSYGDAPLYLCLSFQNDHWLAGKLIFRPNGDWICYVTDNGTEIGFKYNLMNHKNIYILKTPPECYSWSPFDSATAQLPSNFLKGATLVDGIATPICRVFNSENGTIIPGQLGELNEGTRSCVYPYYGEMVQHDNIEILVWSEYAYINEEACSRTTG